MYRVSNSRQCLGEIAPRRTVVEKQLAVTAYWIAVSSTVLAIVFRALAFFGIWLFPLIPGRSVISHRSFLYGAVLFFLMSIAGSVLSSTRSYKT